MFHEDTFRNTAPFPSVAFACALTSRISANSAGIGPAGLPALSALGSSNSQAAFQPVARLASRSRGLGIVLKVEPREVYLRQGSAYRTRVKARKLKSTRNHTDCTSLLHPVLDPDIAERPKYHRMSNLVLGEPASIAASPNQSS